MERPHIRVMATGRGRSVGPALYIHDAASIPADGWMPGAVKSGRERRIRMQQPELDWLVAESANIIDYLVGRTENNTLRSERARPSEEGER